MLELSFREDVCLTQSPQDGSLRLDGRQFNWVPKKLSEGMKAAMEMLSQGPVAEDRLLDTVTELDGASGAIYFYQHLKQLSRGLCYTVKRDGEPLATLVPNIPLSDYQYRSNIVNPDQCVTLS